MSTNPYRAAGTFSGAVYTEREADRDLRKAIELNQRYPYILAPRQSGKSSLLNHVRSGLDKVHFGVGFVDLSVFRPEEFDDYDRFLKRFFVDLAESLNIPAQTVQGLPKKDLLTLLAAISFPRVVLIIDEVDALRTSRIKNTFFSYVRSLFNERATMPELKRLQFVLAGAARATELITVNAHSPFNVGKFIRLDDFSLDELHHLCGPIEQLGLPLSGELPARLHYHTNGSPYLTQLILEQLWDWLADNTGKRPLLEVILACVDSLTDKIVDGAAADIHFLNIAEMVERDPETLRLWRQAVEGESLSELQWDRLGITGLIGFERKVLYRNRIYERVFANWVWARLQLDERSTAWDSKPEIRLLPTRWEYLNIQGPFVSGISKGQAASIFVSYRIKDTLQAADRLAVELRRVFGQDQVFFDRRTIEPGETWPGRIEDAVKRAKVVLVLIGKQWLTVQDEYGRRRIDNEIDWVRREVEEALTIEGRVVPVLVDKASPVPAAALVDLPNLVKLASYQVAKLRTGDWDTDFNALVSLLKSKDLTALAQQVDSGQNVDRARQAEQLISSYQLAIQQRWRELWSGDGTSDKPPFIDTQGLRLLLETDRPEQYLHPAYFRVGRGTRSSMAEQDLGDWVEVDRADLAANELTVANESRVDLSRLVITTDAGVGKTTTMQWLEAELNRPGAATVAFHLTFSHVPAHVDELLCELARRILQKQQRDDESVNLLRQDDAVRIIESLRDEGRLVLILDALDQEPADGSAAILVGELLKDSSWNRCRIVISGRPHALQRHWRALFASQLGWGWRFVQVDEFTPDQQRQFLRVDQRGKNRLELIPQEAREILSTPRVLSYLRELPDADLRNIRTTGNVYWHSVQHLLVEGMQGSEAARKIGLDSSERAPEKVQARSKRRALELLAGLAFEMTSTPIPGGDGGLAKTPSIPNFDGVPSGRFPHFRIQLQKRLSAHASLDRDLDGLAALNEFISQGFFYTTVEGLQEVYWRNRTLQEFFTALWLSQYCTDDDVKQLWDWLHLPDRPETEEYYWVWRFVCEMHSNSRDPKSWLRAIEPIYRPGDGTVAGTRRSSEFIYRAWKPLMTLVKQAEPAAIALHNRFVGEFANEVLSGSRGRETEQVARQFCDSFIDIPAGEFQMGSPPEKQGMGEELRDRWRAYIEQDGDPVERAKKHIANVSFTPGKRGQQEREYWLEWYTELFRDKNLQRLENQLFPQNETPATRVHTVAAFRMCSTPVLNKWYRLFSPGHGESDSSYRDKYGGASPAPDCPVIFVNWYDSWAFAQWARWGEGQCRLPYEYEWEYAAKAGTPWDQNYWWGDEFDATKCNAENEVGHTTPPVASHANPWGLQDMLGNVWEWCEDWYYSVYDPNNVEEGSLRVFRGGCWSGSAGNCRSAYRLRYFPSDRDYDLGFRVALSSSGQVSSPGSAQPRT